jgi:hypothetical protein
MVRRKNFHGHSALGIFSLFNVPMSEKYLEIFPILYPLVYGEDSFLTWNEENEINEKQLAFDLEQDRAYEKVEEIRNKMRARQKCAFHRGVCFSNLPLMKLAIIINYYSLHLVGS